MYKNFLFLTIFEESDGMLKSGARSPLHNTSGCLEACYFYRDLTPGNIKVGQLYFET